MSCKQLPLVDQQQSDMTETKEHFVHDGLEREGIESMLTCLNLFH